MRIHQRVAAVLAAAAATSLITVPAQAAARPWIEQSFVAAEGSSIFVDHNGDVPIIAPFPASIPRFTEPELRTSVAFASKLRDSAGRLVGISTQLETILPDTDIAAGRLHTRTLWTLFLPGRGSITVDEFERHDEAGATIFKPALETGTPWVGDLTVRTTEDDSGTIVAGTGEFAGIRGTAAEFDRITRFDPRAGVLDVTVELRLRYRYGPAARPHGHELERNFFVSTPNDTIVIDHEGTIPIGPFPDGIPLLTEPELRTGFLLLAKVRDASGRLLGLTTELEYILPDSDLPAGKLRNVSLWTLFLPGRGVIVFDERENQDEFATTVVKPVLASGKPWVGDLTFITTAPRTGRIVGGTGEFAGITGTGIELAHVRRLDPVARVMEATTELRLRYRLPC